MHTTAPTLVVTPSPSVARRWPLWTAAALGYLIAVAHTVSGTPENLTPLLAAELAAEPQQVFRVLWHVTTVALFALAAALTWAARAERSRAKPLLVLVWVIEVTFMVVFIAVDLAAFGAGGVLTLPQWVMFAPLVALIPLSR